ncbi:glutathione-disulfide reductase [Entomomonas asaccharolytica]|uniref:Glutathione-disulfide reductase n=1 Tax=Entomomonas asaccharolytica TaxID=2785331 RepID=A0A974RVN1_9GAMM|nr:glutathione-disulfide reductase [Entomomonas asaccharolytica]QQP84318.1 glutathione-disulfide reductase [Entomomonas asaccharolytica]
MSFDYDLFVIGAGSGGVRAARFAAGFGAKVAIAEERYLGGTCVNVGCVPKKLFVYASQFEEEFELAKGFGWQVNKPTFNWQTLVEHKNKEIERLNGIYHSLLVNIGITLIEGHAQLINANTVNVDGKVYTAKNILIAVGGWPSVPEIIGKEYAITSNEAFYLKELPKRCTIVGGGYIAVEFASIFNGLGVDTTLVYRGELFLKGFDDDIRKYLADELTKKGINLKFNTDIKQIDKQADNSLITTFNNDETATTDLVFYATGRRPKLENLGLENTKVTLNSKGFIDVDKYYTTAEPSIFAIGDVIGQIQLTPVALAQGMAVARHLFKPEQYRSVDLTQVATAMFSLPNVATVGLTEQQAIETGYDIVIFESYFRALKLTLTDSLEKTYMKLVVDKESDRVLGCHMIGEGAGELIQGLAIALKAGATKQIFDETIGIHPTAAEEFVTMRTPRLFV